MLQMFIYRYGHVALQQDLYNDEVAISDEDDDSDWEPVQVPTADLGSI